MVPDHIKELRKHYLREMAVVEETITYALCEAYKSITGKQASERFREKIADVVQFDQ